MWQLTACKISVSLSSLEWNDFLSYLCINIAKINSETFVLRFYGPVNPVGSCLAR